MKSKEDESPIDCALINLLTNSNELLDLFIYNYKVRIITDVKVDTLPLHIGRPTKLGCNKNTW
jgi:hypothetical protein